MNINNKLIEVLAPYTRLGEALIFAQRWTVQSGYGSGTPRYTKDGEYHNSGFEKRAFWLTTTHSHKQQYQSSCNR
jgi:hypothetical protein